MTEEKDKYKNLKIAIDILSVIFIVFLLIVCPIWSHYGPEKTEGSFAKLPFMAKLAIADMIPCLFGAIWLSFRYQDPRFLNPRFRLLVLAGFLSMYLIGYLILKNTLWR